MLYFNDTLCIPANQYYHIYSGNKPGTGEVITENFVPYGTYKDQAMRKKLRIVRHGGGEGGTALIALDSIPQKYRIKIQKQYPDPEKTAVVKPLLDTIKIDYKAIQFYMEFRYPDGSSIPTQRIDNIRLWGNNSAILNAISQMYQDHVKARIKLGKGALNKKFFEDAVTAISSEELNSQWKNNLPRNRVRLQQKFELYREINYMAFVKNNAGNVNAVKINSKILRLLSHIATLPTNPYNNSVLELYQKFMEGRVELVDHATGVQYMAQDYLDANGNVTMFTEAAVWQRLNQPGMQVKIDKKRMGAKDYNDIHRPHRMRHSPVFSFSKISMDDRDLVWKDSTTKQRVKAYYAYDVASGCRVGSAYSMDKDETLFLDCLRDMFVFVDRHGFGIPLEVEVENHLVNKFFADLEVMFPYLTICAPGNSQQKRAEHFNRAAKYQVEKNNHPGIGRWWLSSKYNRVSMARVGAEFVERMKPSDKLIADDIQDTLDYNNALHKNQKQYPGMTRMDVLINNLNPNLPHLNKQLIYRFIGFETETSIVRSQYVSVKYAKYMLPSPKVLDLLAPNNRDVKAYYMPDDEGAINEVYLYQNGQFLCTCERVVTYNEAKAERTELDNEAKLKQDKYVAQFDKYVKEGTAEMGNLQVLKPSSNFDHAAPVIVPDKPMTVAQLPSAFENDYSKKALNDFFN